MLSEASQIGISILIITGLTIGGALAYTGYNGPLADPLPPHVEEGGAFLVNYQMHSLQITTGAQPLSTNGAAHFPAIQIPVQNVTRVEVTMQVSVQGASFGDSYEVTVTDPRGVSQSGSHSVNQPTLFGYDRSTMVISWSRTPQPSAESYQTPDRREAARWSAENHTDDSARGVWSGTVALSHPIFAGEGNASLVLQVAYYEAVVLPKVRIVDPEAQMMPTDAAGTVPAAADPSYKALPRTFITQGSVGAAVDRGRPAERPL